MTLGAVILEILKWLRQDTRYEAALKISCGSCRSNSSAQCSLPAAYTCSSNVMFIYSFRRECSLALSKNRRQQWAAGKIITINYWLFIALNNHKNEIMARKKADLPPLFLSLSPSSLAYGYVKSIDFSALRQKWAKASLFSWENSLARRKEQLPTTICVK
jgi:hypothetical protein